MPAGAGDSPSNSSLRARRETDDVPAESVKRQWRRRSGDIPDHPTLQNLPQFGSSRHSHPSNGAPALSSLDSFNNSRTFNKNSWTAAQAAQLAVSASAAGGGALAAQAGMPVSQKPSLLAKCVTALTASLKRGKQASNRLYQKLKRNDRSYFLFGPDHPLRTLAARIVDHRWFNYVTIVLVVANCILLSAYNPECQDDCRAHSPWARVERVADIVFNVVFTAEVVLQGLAKCLVIGPVAYMHGIWAWMDFICVLSGYTAYAPAAYDVSGLRSFRALRPLRTLASFPGMQMLVSTLVGSLSLMLNVVVLIAWVLLVFGIMGLELFKGTLRGRCVGGDGEIIPGMEDQVCRTHGPPGSFSCPDASSCSGTFQSPQQGRMSFDNFGWAVLNILQLITLSNWTDSQMYYVIDGDGYIAVFYFILLILIGSFFALQLLTAIISAKYAQLQAHEAMHNKGMQGGVIDMLPALDTWRGQLALRWARFVKALRRPMLKADMKPWRLAVRRLVANRWFNHSITLMIIINTLIMALYHYGMEPSFATALERINMALTAGFSLEMLLKHIALGYAVYWRSGFNAMDGIIVIMSLVDIIVSVVGSNQSGLSALRTFRLLRVVRSLKLLRQFPSLRKLMKMVVKGFIELKDFMLILVLFLFIFSVLGMHLFGGSPVYSPDITDTYRKNFDSLWQAFYTVFEVLTASNWPSIMHDGMNARGNWAAAYFVLWIIVGHMVLLTLFLAILINNFQADVPESAAITPRSARSFEEDRLRRSMERSMGSADLLPALNQVAPEPLVTVHTSDALLAEERQRMAGLEPSPKSGIGSFARMVQAGGGWQESNSNVVKMRKWLLSIGITEGVKHAKELMRQMDMEEDMKAGLISTPAEQPTTARLWKGLKSASVFARNIGSAVANRISIGADEPSHGHASPTSPTAPAASYHSGMSLRELWRPSDADLHRSFEAPSDPQQTDASLAPSQRPVSPSAPVPSSDLRDADCDTSATAVPQHMPDVKGNTDSAFVSQILSADSESQLAEGVPLLTASTGQSDLPDTSSGKPSVDPAAHAPLAEAEGQHAQHAQLLHNGVQRPHLDAHTNSEASQDGSDHLQHAQTPADKTPTKATHPRASATRSKRMPAVGSSHKPDAHSGPVMESSLSMHAIDLPFHTASSMSPEQSARWEVVLWLRRLSVARSVSEEAEHVAHLATQSGESISEASAAELGTSHQTSDAVNGQHDSEAQRGPRVCSGFCSGLGDSRDRQQRCSTALSMLPPNSRHPQHCSSTAHSASCGQSGSETQQLMDSLWQSSQAAGLDDMYRVPGAVVTLAHDQCKGRTDLGLHKRRSFRIYNNDLVGSDLEQNGGKAGAGQSASMQLPAGDSGAEWQLAPGPVAESGAEEVEARLLNTAAPSASFAGGLGFPTAAAPSGLGLPRPAMADPDGRRGTRSSIDAGSRALRSSTELARPDRPRGVRFSTELATSEARPLKPADGLAPDSPRDRGQEASSLLRPETPPQAERMQNGNSPDATDSASLPRQGFLTGPGTKPANAPKRQTSITLAEGQSHLQYKALWVLGPRNRIRRIAMAIVRNRWFEGFIIVLILVSSILLAATSPSTDPHSTLAKVTDFCDRWFTFIFAAEMVLKVLAMGFVVHPGAYLRIPWNQLDFLIVVTSLISVFSTNGQLAIFRALRTTRALRPLRMISRFKGMAIVVEALVRSVPAVASVVALGIFEFVVFGILGTQLFAGTTYSCNQQVIDGVPVVHRDQCVPGYFECTADDNCLNVGEQTPRLWENSYFNFDNVGQAMMALFVVSTLDDYMENVAYKIMDAVGVDMQPVENHNPAAGTYILVFIFLGSLFWVNLMVGVVIDHYSHLINEMGANVMLTDNQKRWMDLLKLKEGRKRTFGESNMPKNRVRQVACRIISLKHFDTAILTIIGLNIVVMAMPYWGMSQQYDNVNGTLNNVFSFCFAVEAILKITAFGPLDYWADHWNKLDFVIVATSLIDMLPGVNVGVGSTVFRIFRVLRMFKVVRQAKGLRTLFNTLLASLPAIVNVGSLLFLLMFVYAILGMSLFGDPAAPLAQNPHANFNNFGVAMLTLFRTFTGDGWGAILQLASGCTVINLRTCGSAKSAGAALYFISFMVIGSFVMLNLVIAVILDKFVEAASDEGLFRNNDFFEIMQKRMVLDRFVRRLKAKLQEVRESELAGFGQRAKKTRRKSVLNSVLDSVLIDKLIGPGKLPAVK